MPDDSENRTREFADRQTISFLESRETLAEMLRLVSPELAEMLDFSGAVRENRSLIPEELSKTDTDVVYSVPLKSDTATPDDLKVWVYALLEQQTDPDPFMLLRLLFCMVQLWMLQYRGWKRDKKPLGRLRLYPIIPIVLYTGDRNWEMPFTLAELMILPEQLQRFVPQFDTLFLSLRETDDEVFKRAESSLAQVLLAWKSVAAPEAEWSAVIDEVTTWLDRQPEEDWRRSMLFLWHLIANKRPAGELNALIAIVAARTKRRKDELGEIMVTATDVWKSEGRQEGIVLGQREMTAYLLVRKFGITREEAGRRLSGVPDDRLYDLAGEILTADTFADLKL